MSIMSNRIRVLNAPATLRSIATSTWLVSTCFPCSRKILTVMVVSRRGRMVLFFLCRGHRENAAGQA